MFHLFEKLKKSYAQTPRRYPEDPRETFRRHVWVSPFYEDDLASCKDRSGVQRIMLGLRLAPRRGPGRAAGFVKDLERDGYTEAEQQLVLHDNAAALVLPA